MVNSADVKGAVGYGTSADGTDVAVSQDSRSKTTVRVMSTEGRSVLATLPINRHVLQDRVWRRLINQLPLN